MIRSAEGNVPLRRYRLAAVSVLVVLIILVLIILVLIVLILVILIVLILILVLVVLIVLVLVIHGISSVIFLCGTAAIIDCPIYQDLSFALNRRLAKRPAVTAAVMPPAVAFRPPVNTPKKPSSATASRTPLARL